MPYLLADCLKCIHARKCDGYFDRIQFKQWSCPKGKQFIPSYTKKMKSIKAKEVKRKFKTRENFDNKYLT